MREPRKESLLKYRFLVDRDVSKASSFFPPKRICTIAKVGLSQDANDAQIVEAAWERGLTIVTGNGDDFIREINRFQFRTKSKFCRELFGLVILPNGYEIQRRVLPALEARLRLNGARVNWADVAYQNLSVRLKKDGTVDVTELPQCSYCKKEKAS
jgi:hypothetical protein